MNIRSFLYVIIPALLSTAPVSAQDPSDGTLHIVRPVIDAAQDSASLCLEFDHPLDLSSRSALIAAAKLETDGKAAQLSSTNVSITSSLVCFQSLQYRQDYTLTLETARGAKGEKLTEPYRFSFTVPDRPPLLAFTGNPVNGELVRYRDGDPVIRAVNVPRAHIALYRIADPVSMANAWKQRRQTTLAPSESLFFARDKGQLVFEGDLVLKNDKDDKTANRSIEYALPLRAAAGSLAPGLYLVSATGPRTAASTSELAPMAAQWFSISDIKINALPASEGFHVLAEKMDASAVLKDIHFVATNGRTLADTHSGADGLTFLPLAGDKRAEASVLVGIGPEGDVDFLDLRERDADRSFSLPNLQAKISTDRPFYHPGEEVHLTLTARNLYGEAVDETGSVLQILRPDRSPYLSVPVGEGRTGVFYISFPAPPANGAWPLAWQQKDGHALTENPLRVSSNPEAPHLEITADRAQLDKDGDVVLTVKSLSDSGKPVPYITGHIFNRWTEASSLADWLGYSFGAEGSDEGLPVSLAGFTTDANGNTQIRLGMREPPRAISLHAAELTARATPTSGALDSPPLSLPFRPEGGIVGVRPLARDGKFAENSVARFEVIGLDSEGRRRDAGTFEYQIFEEGRSFDWYQAEGRWQYKLQQQRRRIGGGELTLRASGPALIGWPVTSGSYTLEIADEAGDLVSRFHFDAGWNVPQEEKEPAELSLSAPSSFVAAGETGTVNFSLARPALVTAIVADDRIRKIIHQTLPAGDSKVEFKAGEEWGNHVRIEVEARANAGSSPSLAKGSFELAVRHKQKELSLSVEAPDHAESGRELVLPVSIDDGASLQNVSLSLLAVPEARPGQKAPDTVLVRDVSLNGKGKAEIRVPVPDFSGNMRFTVMAAGDSQWGHKDFSLPVRPALAAAMDLPDFMRAGDTLRVSLTLKNNESPAGAVTYALSGSENIKITGPLKGTTGLNPGQSRVLSFEIRAINDGESLIHLGLSDASGNYREHSWTFPVSGGNFITAAREEVAPQKTWQPPALKGKEKIPGILVLSAAPLDGAVESLKALVDSAPFASESMAGWLEAARLWQAEIAKLHLLPEEALKARRMDMLQRLAARQNMDGGFPSLPGHDSDPAATAETLVALERSGEARLKPVADQAAAWLHRRLENTWFDEKERPLRAAVFPALAATGRLDVAALRYFAETSADKNLPPLAAAQLAAALAIGKENDKASFWVKGLQDRISASEILPLLAENPLFDPRALSAAMQRLGTNIANGAVRDPRAIAWFLRSLRAINARAGDWQVSVNNDEKNQPGILILDIADRRAALAVRNPMDRPLYVIAGRTAKEFLPGNGIERRITRLDGMGGGPLEEDGLYAIHLQGAWPADAENILVHDVPGPGLEAVTCILESPPGIEGAERRTAKPPSCEKTEGAGIDALLPADEGRKDWQIVYFARAARAGTFTLAPAVARTLGGNNLTRSSEEKIEIR